MALANSPPTEKPCRSRATKTRMGASRPSEPNDGVVAVMLMVVPASVEGQPTIVPSATLATLHPELAADTLVARTLPLRRRKAAAVRWNVASNVMVAWVLTLTRGRAVWSDFYSFYRFVS